MYLYKASSAPTGGSGTRQNQSFMSRTIGREIQNTSMSREQFKDVTSARLQMKGPKQAAAVERAEMTLLRSQIQAFPEALMENARSGYILQQNNRRKELQDYQCHMMGRLESILRMKMVENGVDYRKYRIGGSDKGTYERFFRMEPGQYMSKAKLGVALRRSFGDNIIRSEAAVNKLFDSFDLRGTDEMDWRAFLYLLVIMLQPSLPYVEHIKWAYALYSSCGSLDIECTEKLSIGELKRMLCVPVLLSMRGEVENSFDKAWLDLSMHDTEAILMAQHPPLDPDDLRITHKMFRRILMETKFSRFMVKSTSFGKKDQRLWTCRLEEEYFHPVILAKIKALRRENRNNDEADQFIAKANFRTRRIYYAKWKNSVSKRVQLRLLCISAEIRAQIGSVGRAFDIWRNNVIALYCIEQIQRHVRGFAARCRRRFIRKIRAKVTKIQAGSRQLAVRHKFRQQRLKVHWAAMTIQRIVRGMLGRKRVQTMVQELYDGGMRQLAIEKETWYRDRQLRACLRIQRLVKRFLRKRRTMKKMEQLWRNDQLLARMEREQEKHRVTLGVYQQELSEWYQKRKEEYDTYVINEYQTKQQKKAIIMLRQKNAAEDRKRKELIRLEKLRKVEEEEAALWKLKWEETIERREQELRTRCSNCLVLPETPEDIQLKKSILKATKKQLKEVLRRADKQKIPMEIPEATEIAMKEVIDSIVEDERVAGSEEMRQEAIQIQRDKELKEAYRKEQEEKAKKRRRRYALLMIQCQIRIFLARKKTRLLAYKRYRKHFDINSHDYYYEDTRTKRTFWKKPEIIGSYDIPIDDHWVLMHDSTGNIYYYNASNWLQSWEQPYGTVLCQECQDNFAVALMRHDDGSYCEQCFNKRGAALLLQGYKPNDVLFKEFDGNKVDALYLDYSSIPDRSWQSLITEVDNNIKLSEEEEERLAKIEARKLKAQRRKKKLAKEKRRKLDSDSESETRDYLPDINKPSRTGSAPAGSSKPAKESKKKKKAKKEMTSNLSDSQSGTASTAATGRKKKKKKKKAETPIDAESVTTASGASESTNSKKKRDKKKKKKKKKKIAVNDAQTVASEISGFTNESDWLESASDASLPSVKPKKLSRPKSTKTSEDVLDTAPSSVSNLKTKKKKIKSDNSVSSSESKTKRERTENGSASTSGAKRKKKGTVVEPDIASTQSTSVPATPKRKKKKQKSAENSSISSASTGKAKKKLKDGSDSTSAASQIKKKKKKKKLQDGSDTELQSTDDGGKKKSKKKIKRSSSAPATTSKQLDLVTGGTDDFEEGKTDESLHNSAVGKEVDDYNYNQHASEYQAEYPTDQNYNKYANHDAQSRYDNYYEGYDNEAYSINGYDNQGDGRSFAETNGTSDQADTLPIARPLELPAVSSSFGRMHL